MRFGAAVFPFSGCCAELHGLGADHRLSYPASAVGLAMKSSFLVFCSGVIFWGGLAVQGTSNPSKVDGLIAMFGELDPSLASGV